LDQAEFLEFLFPNRSSHQMDRLIDQMFLFVSQLLMHLL